MSDVAVNSVFRPRRPATCNETIGVFPAQGRADGEILCAHGWPIYCGRWD